MKHQGTTRFTTFGKYIKRKKFFQDILKFGRKSISSVERVTFLALKFCRKQTHLNIYCDRMKNIWKYLKGILIFSLSAYLHSVSQGIWILINMISGFATAGCKGQKDRHHYLESELMIPCHNLIRKEETLLPCLHIILSLI